ncbi:MAG TPA: DmsC/YnfH family molybdoenzyme membrane anchor subunit [Stellaceae bacterium]|jgi:DMSO reductase anchor subunit
MNPALSIVFFTTSSGAGFALMMLVGLGVPLGLLPANPWFGVTAMVIAGVLAVSGLVSSTVHLGHPERAWRAFSQWRSSWLSREGVLAVLSFVPAAIFAFSWLIFGKIWGFAGLCGIVAAAGSVATIYCTGMIYASLKPIRQWHNFWVVPNYLALGLMSGFLLLDLVERFWVPWPTVTAILTAIAIVVAWWFKEEYWGFIDTSAAPSTIASATALGRRGAVRILERPHTEDNYLLKEMGFSIARKHATRLRLIARLAAFAAPVVLTLIALVWAGNAGVVAAFIAVISAGLGLVVERWLFFAEARHSVTLYYGADAV